MIDDPVRLAARRSNRSDSFFQHLATTGKLNALVNHCLPGRHLSIEPNSVVNHDDRAALVCALTALCVAALSFVAVGDEDGWIILPAGQFIRPEQWALLKNNANEEEIEALHVEGQFALGYRAG